MGNSSKIRHRRRRRTLARARQLDAVTQAIAQALDDLIRTPRRFPLGMTPEVVSKDSHVVTDPCAPLPGLEPPP